MERLLYKIDEVSKMLALSQNIIYELLRDGNIQGHNVKPGYKGLRITAESLKGYIEKYKIPIGEFEG